MFKMEVFIVFIFENNWIFLLGEFEFNLKLNFVEYLDENKI